MNPDTRARPEPAVDVSWLQMGSVTAMEVAESSRCPDRVNVKLCQDFLNHLLLLLGLHADKIHTHLSADVSSIQPACLVASEVGLAREKVVVARPFVHVMFWPVSALLCSRVGHQAARGSNLGLWQPWEKEAEKEPQPHNAHNSNHSGAVFTSARHHQDPHHHLHHTPPHMARLSSAPVLTAA